MIILKKIFIKKEQIKKKSLILSREDGEWWINTEFSSPAEKKL